MKALYTFFENHLEFISGLPAMIVALIALKKYIFKKKNKMTINLPRLSYECIGREEEKKEIKKRILSGKSIFIYGAGGIGKTTVIGYSIQEAQKDLSKIYGRVLYHNFSEGDSFDHVCNNLSLQIDDSGLKRFNDLLSKGKYLIWLDGCENTNCLLDLLNISNNPVFIIATREKDQGNSLLPFVGEDNMMQIGTLSLDDGEHLLSGKLSLRKLLDNNKCRQINKQIIRETNGHPLLIELTKRHYLYKKNPEAYCKELRTKGLEVISDEYKCKDLLKSAFGLDVNTQSERLSLDAQKALGFLGCVSEEGFPDYDDFFVVFNKKVKQELLKTHLIEIHDKKIICKHSLVHTVLRENADKLLDGNYAPLYDFIDKLVAVYIGSKRAYSLNKGLFFFKYHLRDAIKYIITNHLITNSEEENILCVSLAMLAVLGFYGEVLSFMELFTLKDNTNINIYIQAKTVAYIGLENYEKCIACQAEYESTIPECDCDLTLVALHNSIYIYNHFKKYDDALNKCVEFGNYIKTHNLIDDDKYQNRIYGIMELGSETLYWSKYIDDMKDFIEKQVALISGLAKIYNKDDYEIIDAKLILAFSLEEVGDHGDFYYLLNEIFNLINSRYTFEDPHAIGIIEDIGRFFQNIGNYNQANEFYKEILPYSERVFGNSHIITERIRANYEENKAKMEADGIDESKVLLRISVNPRKKNLRTFLENYINKMR